MSRALGSSGTKSTSFTPGEAGQRLGHPLLRVGADGSRANPVHDDGGPRRRDGAELLEPAHQALQPHRVTRADDHDLVGQGEGAERGGVATGRHGVVAELLVVLEAEPTVDDDHLAERTAEGEDALEGGGPDLRPALGLGDAREDSQAGRRHGSQTGERRQVEAALVGGPRGGREPGRLVEERQRLRHRAAVGVGVDEHGGYAEPGQLARQGHRDGGPSGRAGRAPDGHHAALGGVDTDLVDRVASTLRTAAIEVCRRCGRRGGSGPTLRSLVAGQVIGEVISEVALEGQEGLVDGRGGLGECGLEVCQLDAAGDDAADTELTQSSFGVLVTVRSDPDDVHAGRPQLGDHGEVEATQVARDERHGAEPGGGGRHEVGQVRTAADDGDLARALEERGDPAVPPVSQRGEDVRHEVPWPGTGTRVNRDCLSTAAMTSATLSRGTRSWTAIAPDAAPKRPESWFTGETLTR